ncbi:hypothetical protein TcasGA2_TC010465 [Tribolium castaneum]|uniref:Uncharacterized protein n=1 Tax=Tribolium castaneum TaxID=7070 RepID=D6WKT4_TRICA|nr:hypothetical protein TcasGA2_TC010465 [Tribolium castaneum]
MNNAHDKNNAIDKFVKGKWKYKKKYPEEIWTCELVQGEDGKHRSLESDRILETFEFTA